MPACMVDMQVMPDAIPEAVKGQESRFAGAVGAALGMLQV